MYTNKSPLYLPWLLIICVSDDIVVTSQVYKFHFHIVVTSQIINLGLPPLWLCLQTRKCPTLLKQLWVLVAFENPNPFILTGRDKSKIHSHSCLHRIDYKQGDQIGRNFAIWAIFYGIGQFFSRKNSPMIWAKF
jgi:hypothetical protein